MFGGQRDTPEKPTGFGSSSWASKPAFGASSQAPSSIAAPVERSNFMSDSGRDLKEQKNSNFETPTRVLAKASSGKNRQCLDENLEKYIIEILSELRKDNYQKQIELLKSRQNKVTTQNLNDDNDMFMAQSSWASVQHERINADYATNFRQTIKAVLKEYPNLKSISITQKDNDILNTICVISDVL